MAQKMNFNRCILLGGPGTKKGGGLDSTIGLPKIARFLNFRSFFKRVSTRKTFFFTINPGFLCRIVTDIMFNCKINRFCAFQQTND